MSGIKKAFKKVAKPVVKVATLGAIDGKKGGWLGGTDGVLNVTSLGVAGDGPIKGPLNMGAGAAMAADANAKQQAFARAESEKQDKLNSQISNASKLAGLNSEQQTTQVAYGSVSNSTAEDLKRRKKTRSTSNSSSVGIS